MADFGTYVAGQVLTAAELNAAGAWTTYTPTWTNLTVGNATQSFRYSKFNKIGFVQGSITLGTTSTVGTNAYFSLPSGWTAPNPPVSSQTTITDTAIANYYGWLNRWNDTNLLVVIGLVNGTYTQGVGTQASVPFTWGNTDTIEVGVIVRLS